MRPALTSSHAELAEPQRESDRINRINEMFGVLF